MTKKMYQFLKAARGNWHNAVYIRCSSLICPHGRPAPCEGFLMAASADGTPVLMPVEAFQRLSGEYIDPEECYITLGKHSFEAIYALYVEWNTSSPAACSLQQLCGTADGCCPTSTD